MDIRFQRLTGPANSNTPPEAKRSFCSKIEMPLESSDCLTSETSNFENIFEDFIEESDREDFTGLLAKPGSQDQFKKNIEYLYRNKDFRDSCAKAGKQRMIDHFKVEEMINKHIRLYENTINER